MICIYLGIRECVASNAHIVPGKKYSSQGDVQSIHYAVDFQGRVYAIVTNPNYPVRVAFLALEEIQSEFNDFGSKMSTATEESLTLSARLPLKAIAEK